MSIAQKLYENGHITYMRTDSPSISVQAINSIKEYIIEKYGNDYSNPKNYTSKDSAQDAHECIRPTNIKVEFIKNTEQNKLYNLIWKRTLMSQMTKAEIECTIIKIDGVNTNSQSILKLDIHGQGYFYSEIEKIIFLGYMIVDKPSIPENNIFLTNELIFNKIIIHEEYGKLPVRYNEASLVKCLEKNGIGRPSTFVSIITKLLDRKYIEIKDIDGLKKYTKNFELSNLYKLNTIEKEIYVGKELKKFVPTENGVLVNNFMMKYFNIINDINFTSEFEIYLDKIASGNANWITVLQLFYDKINPIIQSLKNSAPSVPPKYTKLSTDKSLGIIDNIELFVGKNKYGNYIKYYKDDKWYYTTLYQNKDMLSLEKAYDLIQYPKLLGKLNNLDVTLCNGKYGIYILYNNRNYSLKGHDNKNITLEYIKNIIE